MTDWKSRQNNDGGWAYARGCSWTEPTGFVLLAQSASEDASPDHATLHKAQAFLNTIARQDGGFSPQAGVDESTWVTALVALLPEDVLEEQQRHGALEWLKKNTGQESSWTYRLRQRMSGNKEEFPEGWPWFPGAAAWVIPTSLGILAFERALRHGAWDRNALETRIAAGKRFLLGRMCADGGWNHGSSRALGRDGDSYPETTGIALLALHKAYNSETKVQLEKAKTAARRHLATCRAAEGIAWLKMGLNAHGEMPATPTDPVCRTNMDEALTLLSRARRNPLLT